MGTTTRLKPRHGLLGREPRSVRPIVHQRIERVAQCHYASQPRDRAPAKSFRITPSGARLVMVADDRQQARRRLKWTDDGFADRDVFSHARGLSLVEWPRFEED